MGCHIHTNSANGRSSGAAQESTSKLVAGEATRGATHESRAETFLAFRTTRARGISILLLRGCVAVV
jgi:hypothetical protein